MSTSIPPSSILDLSTLSSASPESPLQSVEILSSIEPSRWALLQTGVDTIQLFWYVGATVAVASVNQASTTQKFSSPSTPSASSSRSFTWPASFRKFYVSPRLSKKWLAATSASNPSSSNQSGLTASGHTESSKNRKKMLAGRCREEGFRFFLGQFHPRGPYILRATFSLSRWSRGHNLRVATQEDLAAALRLLDVVLEDWYDECGFAGPGGQRLRAGEGRLCRLDICRNVLIPRPVSEYLPVLKALSPRYSRSVSHYDSGVRWKTKKWSWIVYEKYQEAVHAHKESLARALRTGSIDQLIAPKGVREMEDVVHSHAMAFHCLRWEWRLQKVATVRESLQIENLDDLHRIYPDLDRCFDQQLKSQFFRPAGRPPARQHKSCRKKVGLDASVETDVVMPDEFTSDLTPADPLEESRLEQIRLEQAAFKSSRRADLIHQLMALQSGKVKRRSKKVSKSGKSKNDRTQPHAGGRVSNTDESNTDEPRNSSTNHPAQSPIQGALDPSMDRYKASLEYWYDAISGHDDPLDGLLLEAFERAQQEIGVDVLKWLLKVESSHSVQAHRNEQRLYKIRRQQRFANALSWAELFEELRHYTFAISSESPLPQKPPVQTSL